MVLYPSDGEVLSEVIMCVVDGNKWCVNQMEVL